MKGMSASGHMPGIASGFTLAELLIIVTLISIVALISFPILASFSRSVECRKGARDIAAAVRGARSLAITTYLEHRVEIDLSLKEYRLTRGDRPFNSTNSSWENNILQGWTPLPKNIYLRANAACDVDSGIVYFHMNPNGSGNTRYICVMDANGDKRYRTGVHYSVTGKVVIQKWSEMTSTWQ